MIEDGDRNLLDHISPLEGWPPTAARECVHEEAPSWRQTDSVLGWPEKTVSMRLQWAAVQTE